MDVSETAKSYIELYSYNGVAPKYDLLLMGVTNNPGKEFLAHRILPLRHPEIMLGWDDNFWEDDILEMLPEKGVYNVIALGNIWGTKYWTDSGYEYDGGINWTIIAANKFWCFGDLKLWYKNWRRENAY